MQKEWEKKNETLKAPEIYHSLNLLWIKSRWFQLSLFPSCSCALQTIKVHYGRDEITAFSIYFISRSLYGCWLLLKLMNRSWASSSRPVGNIVSFKINIYLNNFHLSSFFSLYLTYSSLSLYPLSLSPSPTLSMDGKIFS